MFTRPLVIAAVLVACVAGVFLYDYYGSGGPDGTAARGGELVPPHAPVIGPAAAPVTIVEFFDPACEACAAFHPILGQILALFPQEVRLVLRYTPFHEGSDEAAGILEAARAQGRFEPVLGALFARQAEWAIHGAPDLARAWEIAATAGLDVARARSDAGSDAVARVLRQDLADARAHAVQQTPTFFVNGKPLPTFGAQPLYDLVRSEVEAGRGG